MKRKKLSNAEKNVISTLESRQNSALISLRIAVDKIISKSTILKKKIEENGQNTNYSSSSDILKVAEDIYRLELTLSQLKMIQSDIEYNKENKETRKKKNDKR